MVFWTKIGVLSVKKNAFNQKLFSMQLKCKSWIYFYVTIDVSTVLLDKIKKANLVWIKRIRSSNTLIYQSITCRFMTFSLSTRSNVVCLNYSLRAVGTEIQFACHLSLHADLVCCFVCLFCVQVEWGSSIQVLVQIGRISGVHIFILWPIKEVFCLSVCVGLA